MQLTRAEYVADAVVHGVALMGASIATVVAIRLVSFVDRPLLAATLLVYLFGLFAVAVASSLYLANLGGRRQQLWQRVDHASIFIMIAGTYTPFCVYVIPAPIGPALLAVVWTVAGAGAGARLAGARLPDGVATALYLAIGWLVLIALPPLLDAMSSRGLILLIGGGVLYTLGVLFYRWHGLIFQRAIWHVFVCLAATCHFFAVLGDVVAVAGEMN